MAKQILGVSVIEDGGKPLMPDDVQRIGNEALLVVWQVCCKLMEEQAVKARNEFERKEQEYKEKIAQDQDVVERLSKEITQVKQVHDILGREHKNVSNTLERRNGELQAVQSRLLNVEERNAGQDQEIRRLNEETGRVRESADGLQRRLDETKRQAKLDEASIKEAREELAAQTRIRERLEAENKVLHEELDKLRERVKTEQTKAAVAEAIVEEGKSALKKVEMEMKTLRAELQQAREALEAETKSRNETERKVALLSAQLEAQDRVHRDSMIKLEQENNASKAETMNLRNRLIKAEGALEREKKAVERLEARLATSGGNSRTGM